MRLAVISAGGVGGYFGGQLARGGVDVALVARGAHLAALKQRGLRVRSVSDDFAVHLTATDNPADIGPCDYVLFCVKSYDTAQAAALLGPVLRPDTPVISLQNGINNEEQIAARIGSEHVLGGVAFISSQIGRASASPGRTSVRVALTSPDARERRQAQDRADGIERRTLPLMRSLPATKAGDRLDRKRQVTVERARRGRARRWSTRTTHPAEGLPQTREQWRSPSSGRRPVG